MRLAIRIIWTNAKSHEHLFGEDSPTTHKRRVVHFDSASASGRCSASAFFRSQAPPGLHKEISASLLGGGTGVAGGARGSDQ